MSRLVWLAALLVLALQVLAFHGVRSDDAYITYRYGQNLASGHGLTFNPGQRVQGSTSPGGMLLAALVYAAVGLALTPGAMAILGCAGWTAQALACSRLLTPALGARAAGGVGLAVGLGVAGAAPFVPLETHLVAAAVLWTFVLARERRWLAAAAAAGVAVVLRPDAALAAGIVLLGALASLRRRAAAPIGVFLVLALPWPLFAASYYGSPLPQTAIAKFQRAGLGEYLVHELRYPGEVLFGRSSGALAWLVLAVALAGAVRLWRRDRTLAPWLAYGALHLAAYAVLRPPMQHVWHLYPWALVCAVCALAALVPIGMPSPRGELVARRLAFGLALVALAARFADDSRRVEDGYWSGQRDAVYRRIAAYLAAQAPAGSWYASVEVGTISYFSGLPAYDLGGLVTRRDDPIEAHPVRFIVADRAYQRSATPTPPVFSARQGEFEAAVYVPPGAEPSPRAGAR